MVYLDLILNLALLVALSIVSGFIEKRCPRSRPWGPLFQGLLFGGAAVLGMLRPLVLGPGLIFDGRSVMLSLCALFFGPWAAATAGVMTIACRLWLGGVGTLMGVSVILCSMGIGLLARSRIQPGSAPPSARTLYLFGLAVHLAMLALMFTLPPAVALATVQKVGLPVLLLYPLATVLGGKVLADQAFAARFVEALRKSEETYRRLFEDHAAVKLIIDPVSGSIVDANQAAVDFYGWPRERLVGMKVQEINTLPPEALAREMEKAKTQQRIRFAFRHRRADGSIRDVEVFSSRIAVGGAEFLHSIVHDVTEHKRLEAQLRQSDDLLANLAAQVPGVVYQYRLHPDGRSCFPYASPGMQEIYEVAPEAVREDATPAFGRLHPEDRDRVAEAIQASARTLEPFHCEFRVVLPRQGLRWRLSDAQPQRMADGGTLWHGIISDITARKRAEAERERLLAAIEQTGEAVCITDVDGTIQYVNPAFEAVTGYGRGEAVGNTPRIQKSGAQDEAFYRVLWETITSGKTWKGHIVNRNRDGNLYTEDATISPVCDAMGRIVNFVAVKRDITEHQRLAAQLLQAQKMESVGRLAGGVAHDFNNMLMVILGHVEILLDGLDPAEPLHADLSAIRHAAETSARITRQLLAFARQQTIAPKVLDLNDTVEGMLKMLRRLIGEDIDLAWHPGRHLWPVMMDPSQIDQVLANLCVNARDAIAGVGKVTIETDNVLVNQAFSEAHAGFAPGEFAMLAVSDDGCGMDKATLGKIFDPFFTTKAVGQGTGLGLATVYGIVQQNKGIINVYSEPGRGTTFRIYLPRAAGDDTAARAEAPEETAPRGDETVLLVEDEPAILHLGRKILERLGYAVLAAGTPEAALQLAGTHAGTLHLVMTDVVMPGMNGRDLANRLRRMHPGIRCLFMSGYTANVIAHHGVLDPGVHFIQKPFSVSALAAKMREALAGD